MIGRGKLVHGIRHHIVNAEHVPHILQAQPSIWPCTRSEAQLHPGKLLRQALHTLQGASEVDC